MDLHGVDLNLLVAFDALMTERSVTRAGNRIGRTQPAMSAALSRLRSLLDDELFVRGGGQLQPTQRALELSEPLGQALRDIERTLGLSSGFDPSTARITFTVAMQEHAAFKLLPALYSRLSEEAPAARLNILAYRARDEALARLDAGECDLAVGVPPSSAPGRIFTRPLFEEPFVCILRKGHPASSKPLDMETFLSLKHILVSPEGDRFGLTDEILAAKGLTRTLSLTVGQMYAAPSVVAGSDLIATLMRGVVEGSGWRDRVEVMTPPIYLESYPYVMIWHRRTDNHPAQRWIRSYISALI